MRIALPLVCFSLLVTGCMSTQAEQQVLRKLLADYRSIEPGMTEEAVVDRLGAPIKGANKDPLTLHWRQPATLDPMAGQYAVLDVSFDGDGRVLEANFHVVKNIRYQANPTMSAPSDPRPNNPLTTPIGGP